MMAVELVVAAMDGAVKFLTVRWRGLTWLLAVCAMAGCSEPREGSRGDELCPSNLEELVALSAAELERVDVGRMNLVCADAVSGLGESELPRLLRRLDEWAEDARRAEMRYRQTYEREPMRYDNSYAKYCAEANGKLPQALFFYRAALKYRPKSAILHRLAGRHILNGGNR